MSSPPFNADSFSVLSLISLHILSNLVTLIITSEYSFNLWHIKMIDHYAKEHVGTISMHGKMLPNK